MICNFFHCQNGANHDCHRDFCFVFRCLSVSFRFVSFVVSWCTHPMFLPIVQDNRLRVERDELQHKAQEAEKTAALRKEVLRVVVGHPTDGNVKSQGNLTHTQNGRNISG